MIQTNEYDLHLCEWDWVVKEKTVKNLKYTIHLLNEQTNKQSINFLPGRYPFILGTLLSTQCSEVQIQN